MSITAWLKLAQKIARTKLVQGWRRMWTQNSADELRRREREKEIADIASYHDEHFGV